MHAEFSKGEAALEEGGQVSILDSHVRGNAPVDNLPVDNSMKPSGRRHSGSLRPSELAALVERIIRESGRPMTRGEIVEALDRRDVEIPGGDKARYIGTIMWRQKSTFLNIEGAGYWLRSEPRSYILRGGPG